jgi:uncharacterized protein (DUF2336 family)
MVPPMQTSQKPNCGTPPAPTSNSLIADLESAVQTSSPEQRVGTLRRISDLFLVHADSVSEAQIGLFDDVLVHLTATVENRALAELSMKLAPVDNAPRAVVRQLARHDDIAVAAPVLASSRQLTDDDLVEIAQTKTQAHLFAISGRALLGERVTDVLVDRGDRDVVHRVAANAGAAFSEVGFTRLVKRAEGDDVLAERVVSRLDLPAPILRELLQRATNDVRTRILASAPLDARDDIRRVLAAVSNEVVREAIQPRDFTRAKELVARLKERGELGDGAILEFANDRRYEEMVAGLALLCSAPIGMIERLMRNVRPDGLVVACKAAELKWAATGAIVASRFAHHTFSAAQMQEAKADFLKLSVPTAQRVFRFWLIRESAVKTT